MSNNNTTTASVENLKEEHETELQNYIEMCSGLNDQLSQLSEALAQNSQSKIDLQAMVDQLLVEKQSLEISAQNKEELIKLSAENSSRMSSLEARIGKIYALKRYDQLAINTSCFGGSIPDYQCCAISRNFCCKNNEYINLLLLVEAKIS